MQAIQNQSSRGVLMKRCSENMRQIYWRTNVRKCDMNNVGTAFRKNTFGGLFLAIQSIFTNSYSTRNKRTGSETGFK